LSNNLLTVSYITNEALVVLENELVIANRVDRQYSAEFAQTGAKIGNTANIRRPPRYIGTYGPPLNVEDTNETYVPVPLNYQFHVDIQFTTQDLALSMDMFKKRVLKPQIATVANRIDADTAQYCMYSTAAVLGVFGTSPSTLRVFTDARALLASEACPREGEKSCVLDPTSMSSMVAGVSGLFNPQARIGEFTESGMIAKEFAGLDWYEDQNIPVLTTGAQGGTPVFSTAQASSAVLASGWTQSGTIYTTGWTDSTDVVKVGDTIQIGTVGGTGVYPVNPQNRQQYGKTLRQFVVLPPGGFATPPNGAATTGIYFAPATLAYGTFNATTGVYTSNASGVLQLTIGDSIIYGGQFQNVTSAPANGATITVNGGTGYAGVTSPQGLVFHKYAFALAFADLPLPRGVEFAERAYDDEDVQMSIRVVSQYTINNDSEPTRADVLYGPASLYRTLGIRIAG
jgi:P22 coat protein - gene protein 5